MTGSRGSSISTRSSISTNRRSAARRARTRRPIPAPSRRSATGSPGSGGDRARLQGRALLLQRQGRALRGLPGRRRHQDRDAFPARRLCPVRRLQGQALRETPGRLIQGQVDRRRRRAGRRIKAPATSRARLYPYRPTGDAAFGGDAQRVSFWKELSRRATPRRATTGLDAQVLEVLHRLVETVGGDPGHQDRGDHRSRGRRQGGRVVAVGTPEQVAQAAGSYTGGLGRT